MKSLRIEMKRLSFIICHLSFSIALAFTACSSSDDIIDEQPVNPTEPKTYTMTIQATKGGESREQNGTRSSSAEAQPALGEAKGGATTRALSLSGKTLTATWKTGETVDVYKVTDDNGVNEYTSVGTLSAQADGETATLSGNLTGTFAKNDILALFFNGGVLDYGGQTGTLENIASKYDYATATAEVSAVDGSTITVVNAEDKAETIPFDNQQAIVKFTLKDKTTGDPISMKSLRLHDANNHIIDISDFLNESDHMGDIVVTRSTAGSEFYVAIKTEEDYVEPNLVPSSLDLTLTAIGDNNNPSVTPDIYTYTKSGVQFECGKYYEITVKMTKQAENVVSLTWIGSHSYNYSHSYTAQTGDVLTGVATDYDDPDDDTKDTSANIEIKIADGAIVTLRDMTLDGSNASSERAGITCEGDATIILEGTNSVTGFDSGYPGISVPEGKTLTIQGDGSLTVRSNGAAAGIGASGGACGNIVINSGTVTAYAYTNYEGSTWGAGIGGCRADCGDITINGGTVTACGGWGGAGIGSGYGGACGNITINGGSVTATGGGNAAGIGGGMWGRCGNITIAKTITSVSATKGNNTSSDYNKYTDAFSIGIGGDYTDYHDLMICACGTITFDTQSFTPTKHLGDDNHDNSWTYSPEPASGTYGGLTLTISGDTWTLTPAN